MAVNTLFGQPLTKQQLVLAGLQAEAAVSGYHADNIAPALLGGFILIRCVCGGVGGACGWCVWWGVWWGVNRMVCITHAALNIINIFSYLCAPTSIPLVLHSHLTNKATYKQQNKQQTKTTWKSTIPSPPTPYRSCDPLDIQQLEFAGDLWFVLVNPKFEAPTAQMRAVLPTHVPMKQVIQNSSMGATLVCLGVGC